MVASVRRAAARSRRMARMGNGQAQSFWVNLITLPKLFEKVEFPQSYWELKSLNFEGLP